MQGEHVIFQCSQRRRSGGCELQGAIECRFRRCEGSSVQSGIDVRLSYSGLDSLVEGDNSAGHIVKLHGVETGVFHHVLAAYPDPGGRGWTRPDTGNFLNRWLPACP